MIKINPQISIIIPVYNAEKYLRKCLDSIVNQIFSNYEVILVDDGSTDRSFYICKEYCDLDSRFIAIKQENKGVSEARNNGIRNCHGEYVTFMDSDDWAENEWLQAYWRMIQKTDCDMLVQGVIADFISFAKKNCVNCAVYHGEDVYKGFSMLEKSGLGGFVHNKLYRKDIIQKHGLMFRYLLHEDTLFNVEYVRCISSLGVVPEAYYHYVQRKGDSLVKRRYPFAYMLSLFTDLKDARIRLASHFHRDDCKDIVWRDYLSAYTVLLASLYDDKRGIALREKRINILKSYQAERKKRQYLKMKFAERSKSLFAWIVLMNPYLFDFFFVAFTSIRKFAIMRK